MGFGSDAVLDFRAFGHNDLEAAAIRVAPQIETVLKRLSKVADAKAFGMSGSGATCFALFSDRRTAAATQRSLAADHPEWWIKATKLR
jgi:4-diphosphocytidyl-2-C-methyl-D-erythritol kinase